MFSYLRAGFLFRAIISQGNKFLFQDSNPKPAQKNSLRAEPVTIHPLRSFSYKLRLSRDSPSNFKFLCDQSVQRFFNSFKKYLMLNKKRFLADSPGILFGQRTCEFQLRPPLFLLLFQGGANSSYSSSPPRLYTQTKQTILNNGQSNA